MKILRNLSFSFLLCVLNASLILPQQSILSCATDPNSIQEVGQLSGVTWTLKILLVEFKDVKHKSPGYTYTDFNNLFFSNGVYASPNMYSPDGEQVYGSMRDYYSKISNGEFTLTGYVVNVDSNSDGIPDWLSLPHNKGEYDSGIYSFISDAFAAANSAGLDISTNSTTKLAVIYAGMTYRGGSLTPYANALGGTYYINGELFAPGSPYREERSDAKFSEIGINAHEFGHLLGWPDFYGVDEFGNGRWDLMASGNYNGPNARGACPAPPNPKLRADKGWLSFNNITQNQTVQADYYLNNPEVFQIANSTNSGNYWLIETRKFNSTMQIGSTNIGDYNTYTPHGNLTQGVLVWRINETITLLHASGVEWEWETTGPGYDGDPFPGSANVKVLSPWTDTRTLTYNYYWIPNTKPSNNVGMEIAGEGDGFYTINLYYSTPPLPYVISSDLTIDSNCSSTQNVTVNSGITLTLSSGIQLIFANSKSLIVNGTLNAQGSSENKITFTSSSGTWNGIQFNPGSSGNVQYCNINNASIGILCNSSSPTIQYNNLNNITNIGIYLYNTSPNLFYNTIQGSSGSYGYNGIRCEEYSSPYIAHNTIRYFTAGVCNYLYSSPIFSEYGFSEGHNKIVRTNTAIYGWYYSSPRVGQNGYPWGYNYIDSASTYNVEAAWYTNIMAENNWWGTSSPPSNKFNAVSNSSIDYIPYLTSPPSLSIINSDSYSSAVMPVTLKKTNGTASTVLSDLSSNSLFDDEDIKVALRYEFEQEYQSAFDIYEKVFKKELNTAKGRYALVRLGDCFFKLNRNEIDKYLAGISESYKSLKKDEITVIALDLINRELLTNGECEKVADNMRKIKNEFSINSEIEKSALYGLISLYVNCLGDIKTAASYYEELKQKYPEDELLTGCEILLGNQYKASLNEKIVNDNELNNQEEVLMTTNNYPNPFNPSTVISYQLPERNFITIKVYDILGREIATLVNEYKEAGNYSVEFSANKYQLSSGIYFYTLKAGKNFAVKKMMLVK